MPSTLKTVKLKLPCTAADLAALEIGTVAYLTGRVFTAREDSKLEAFVQELKRRLRVSLSQAFGRKSGSPAPSR